MYIKGDEVKMNVGNQTYYNHSRNLLDECKKHLYYHVMITMADGTKFDGIIENADTDRINVLVGEDVMEQESENNEDRQYYGYFPPRRRFRRFRRRTFPLAAIAALALLPYIAQPAYPYYPYPYY
jgi:hypothetical protein